jgi:hypothetical protein
MIGPSCRKWVKRWRAVGDRGIKSLQLSNVVSRLRRSVTTAHYASSVRFVVAMRFALSELAPASGVG